jgi:uncharacterized membrane protein YdjX (TVP38/TMEM64 family)
MQWLKGHKKEILKSLLLVLIVGAMAGCGYGILRLCGFSSQEDFIRLRDDLGDSIWFWLVIAALQIFQVIFIPVSNQLVTVPCALCFQDELWKVFLTSWLSIWFATMILWAIGKFGGKKVLAWILGDKEQVDRCSKWLSRGWIFYPLGMLLPLPDDIVTVLAGTADFKFLVRWHLLVMHSRDRHRLLRVGMGLSHQVLVGLDCPLRWNCIALRCDILLLQNREEPRKRGGCQNGIEELTLGC